MRKHLRKIRLKILSVKIRTHLDLSKMDCYEMESNTLYWGNSTFIHESLPVQEDVKRQLVRITLPADDEELV